MIRTLVILVSLFGVAFSSSISASQSIKNKNFLGLFSSRLITPINQLQGKETAPYIVNGNPANLSQFPYQASIELEDIGRWFCGGSLVAPKWVLTAGHCTDGATSATIEIGFIHLYATDDGRITRTSVEIITHPKYHDYYLKNDVGMIKLNETITPNERVKIISLASSASFVGVGIEVTVSGWGRTNRTLPQSEVLLFANLTATSNAKCASYYGSNSVIGSTLCCQGTQYRSSCNGDSGGPVVVYDEKNVPIQVAVVSFGSSKGCGLGYPVGFARVASFADWIYQNIVK